MKNFKLVTENQMGILERSFWLSVWRTDGIHFLGELHTQWCSRPSPGPLPPRFPDYDSSSNQDFSQPLVLPYFLSWTLVCPALCGQGFSSCPAQEPPTLPLTLTNPAPNNSCPSGIQGRPALGLCDTGFGGIMHLF